jgi:hypothetical protein
MGILDELLKKSTGMQSLLGGSMDETSMPVEYSKDQAFSDPYTNVKPVNTKFGPTTVAAPFKYGEDGKPIDAVTGEPTTPIDESAPSGSIVPPEKPNAINQMAKLPNLFENVFGMSVDKLSENWKEKGGFEGLMANPGFLLGMSILQSSAQGKSIGSGVFDAAVKAGTISAAYADRIKARATVVAPISDAQREEVRSVLAESDIFTGSVGQKFKNFIKGKNTEALNRRAIDDIATRAIDNMKKDAAKYGGKQIRSRREYFEEAAKALQKENKIEMSEKGFMSWLFGRGVQSKAPPLAKGGPVKAGKDYIVGEEGPEMFVSETNGTIINNDDSKVVSMLLESNPQLKNVSKARAVKILKARFPDYF